MTARPERTALDQRIIDRIQDRYDLGKWRRWRRTEKGAANRSFFVTTERGGYVLRVSNDRKTEAGIRFEVGLIEHLLARGYPAPEVVRTRDGAAYDVDGTFYLVTRLIPGKAYDLTNPGHLAASARALARYHVLVRDYPEQFVSETNPPLEGLGTSGPTAVGAAVEVAAELCDRDGRRRLEDISARIADRFRRVPERLQAGSGDLPRLVVQGSFGRSALLYEGDDVVGVVDYDRAGYDDRVLDLVYALKGFARETDRSSPHFGLGLDLARTAAFMSAYLEVGRLEPSEVAALPGLFWAQRLNKVTTKAANFVRKHTGSADRAEKDAVKLLRILETEAERLRWFEAHEAALAETVHAACARVA